MNQFNTKMLFYNFNSAIQVALNLQVQKIQENSLDAVLQGLLAFLQKRFPI